MLHLYSSNANRPFSSMQPLEQDMFAMQQQQMLRRVFLDKGTGAAHRMVPASFPFERLDTEMDAMRRSIIPMDPFSSLGHDVGATQLSMTSMPSTDPFGSMLQGRDLFSRMDQDMAAMQRSMESDMAAMQQRMDADLTDAFGRARRVEAEAKRIVEQGGPNASIRR